MLLAMIIQGVTILGCIGVILMSLNNSFKMSIETGGSSNMLGESSKEGRKAKELDKPPLNNPNTAGGNTQAPVAGAGGGYSQPSLPDMKGADYGSYGGDTSNLPDMASGISGGGAAGVVGVAGIFNLVGIGAQSGEIANYNIAAKQVIKGPIRQGGGMIYTDKLKSRKNIIQMASSSILNNVKGISPKLTQNAPARNAISASRASIIQRGTASSYISGPVNRIRNGRTENLKLRAPLKVQKLIVKKFTANKATSNKMKQLASGVPAGQNQPMGMPASQNQQPVGIPSPQFIGVNVNDIGLNKTNVTLKAQNDNTVIGIQNVLGQMGNVSVNAPNESVRVFSVSRVREPNSFNTVTGALPDIPGLQATISRASVLMPDIPKELVNAIGVSATMMAKQKNNERVAQATQRAEEITNANGAVRDKARGLMDDPSSPAGIRIQKFMEENSKEYNTISDERMKEIEKEAWEITEARKDIPLEEKEEAFEKEKEERIRAEGGITKDDFKEILIDRIIENPEFAQAIMGEEGAKQLQDAINEKKEEKDKVVVQELIKQDVEEHREFVKNNPKAKGKSYYEVLKERRDQEMDKNIMMAASQLYANKSRDFDKSKYQQTMPQGNNDGMAQNQAPQPTGASQIFIARGAQDRSSAGGV